MRLSGKVNGQWFRCRACRAVWEASAWHCIHCHDTFAGDVSAAHRPATTGKQHCTDPAITLGWVKTDGRWQPPAPQNTLDTILEAAREYQIDEQSLGKRPVRGNGTSDPAGGS